VERPAPRRSLSGRGKSAACGAQPGAQLGEGRFDGGERGETGLDSDGAIATTQLKSKLFLGVPVADIGDGDVYRTVASLGERHHQKAVEEAGRQARGERSVGNDLGRAKLASDREKAVEFFHVDDFRVEESPQERRALRVFSEDREHSPQRHRVREDEHAPELDRHGSRRALLESLLPGLLPN
jgi:hypothetical protein